MTKGEGAEVSGTQEPGSQGDPKGQVSEGEGTTGAAPEEIAAQLGTLQAAVLDLTHQTKIIQGELHKERTLRDHDREDYEAVRQADRQAFRDFLGGLGDREDTDAKAIQTEFDTKLASLDQQAKLKAYEAREKAEQTWAGIRQHTEQMVKDLNQEFGVEIPADKVPDPRDFGSWDEFNKALLRVAVEQARVEKKPPAEGEDKPTQSGASASLGVGPGAAPKENPLLKTSGQDDLKRWAKEARRKAEQE